MAGTPTLQAHERSSWVPGTDQPALAGRRALPGSGGAAVRDRDALDVDDQASAAENITLCRC